MTPGRAVPSSFDGSDPSLDAILLPFSYRWKTLSNWLRVVRPRIALLRTPPFWQLEALAADACRTARIPIHFNDPSNMPLARAAIAAVPIDALVTSAATADAFLKHLSESGSRIPKHWLLIHDQRAADWSASLKAKGIAVASEVHLYPGVPILYQCRLVAGTGLFHRVPGAALTFATRTLRKCRCGKATITRL